MGGAGGRNVAESEVVAVVVVVVVAARTYGCGFYNK